MIRIEEITLRCEDTDTTPTGPATAMKTARISLAVAAGILMALGYAACSDHASLTPQRIIIGLMFGTAMTIRMIFYPPKGTTFQRNAWLIVGVPLLIALVIHEALNGTRAEALITAAVSVAFLGIQIAFAALPADAEPENAAASSPKGWE